MPTQKEIKWFESLYFNYDTNPDLGNFLIENREVTEELARALGEKKVWHVFGLGLPVIKDLIKSTVDLRVLVELARASGEKNVEYVFAFGLPVIKDLIKSTVDLRSYGLVLVELARASGEKNVEYVFVNGLPKIKDLIKSTDDLRECGLVLVELARASGEKNVKYVFGLGLPVIKDLIKSTVDLRSYGLVLVELARASGEKNVKYVFEFGLPVIEDLIKSTVDLRSYGLVSVELVNLSGKYVKVFFADRDFLVWFFNERRLGNNFSLKELLLIVNKRNFPGFEDGFYEVLDPRICKFKNKGQVLFLLNRAKFGRNDFFQWYGNFNVRRLGNLVRLGVDLDFWLGRKLVIFKDVVVRVCTGEKQDIVDRELPRLREWFVFLLDCVNDRNFVLAQILSRVEKAGDLENLFVFLRESPASIPAFVRDVVFSVVKEQSDLSSIPEKDLRKLVNVFYGRELGRAKARKDSVLSHELESEFEFVRAMDYRQLIRDLPGLRVGSYLMARLGEFSKSGPVLGRESDLSRALHELESVAQAVQNLLAEQGEKYKTTFKGKYYVNFRVSDKFPLEVLTIGADGHACIQPDGQAESAGFNYFNDSDALLVEILSKKTLRKSERIGMILCFACVDDKNRPVLGLNTVEIAKSWPDDVKDSFYEASTNWLISFAKKAGFKAVMIGKGYGSGWFKQKYGQQNISFRKLNPYPANDYYTNTFEHCKPIKTNEGIILQFQGEGTIIWEEGKK